MRILLIIALAAMLLFFCSESLSLTVAPGELFSFLSQYLGSVVFLTLIPALIGWTILGKKS